MTPSANRKWDAFISHASEDKDDFVRPLAEGLQERGLSVWFDEFELKVGDSLRECIDRGLSRSRFGIVVLSPHFFKKQWPQNELNGLVTRETGGGKVILPVWHNIDAEAIRTVSPVLADRVATSSSNGLTQVIEVLMQVIGPPAAVAVGSPTAAGAHPTTHQRAATASTLGTDDLDEDTSQEAVEQTDKHEASAIWTNEQRPIDSQMNWPSTILMGVLTALIAAWLMGFLNRVVPPPERAWLALENIRWNAPQIPEESFRIVLCWLEGDRNGEDTRIVEQAFSNINGVTLVRSARDVTASGAADEWNSDMRQSARAILKDWNADLVVAGRVKRSGDVLSLWIVPRLGEGTLDRGDRPYKLEEVTLGADFHEDLRTQLAGVALAAVAPLADNDARGRILKAGLRDATEKLIVLLDSDTIQKPGYRAALQVALGDGLHRLGERERGTKRLEQAVDAYRAALTVYTRDRVPDEWARTQNNLGNALLALGKRESGTKRLEQAAAAYRAALSMSSRERNPLDWAATHGNLGSALLALGTRETGRQRLEEALEVYSEALKVSTRENAPLQWAATQNNLGNALLALGQRETGMERLEQAVTTHRRALEEFTRERVPLDWANTQTNLGNALMALGVRETGTERVQEAVEAYRAALEERTRERVPLDWAQTQKNLGVALATMGERQEDANLLNEAVDALRTALEERTRERVPLDWAQTQDALGSALRVLGVQKNDIDRLREAAAAYRAALMVRTRERVPLQWAETQNNLGNTLLGLGKRAAGEGYLEEAVVAYRNAFEERTRERNPLDWALTQNNLGKAFFILGEQENDRRLLEQASIAYLAALEVIGTAGPGRYRELVQSNLGEVLLRLRESQP